MPAQAMTILEAMDDPNLFGTHFRGESWGAWRAFLAALFALPMDEAQEAIYRHHTGRTALPGGASKEAVLVCGRRAGKSRVVAFIATYLATFRSYEEYLAPGEVATIAVIAANQKQARSIFRYISGALNSIGLLKSMVENETAESIVLNNRVVIEIATASFRVTRGYTYAAVLADEIAFWRSEESANPDEEIIKAIRPGLSTVPGAMLLLASSPYAKRGLLYNLWKRHYGQDGARVLVWRGTTQEMNPRIDPDIIAEAYQDDPEAASAEYGAEFRNDIAAFVAREVVDACTPPGRYEVPYITGNAYRAFVDPSGGTSDSMTLAIAHQEGRGTGPRRAVLDAVREVKPPFSPEQTVEEFATLLKSYRISRVTGDRYAGEWPREQFRKHGIQYDLADKPKSDIYRDLLPMLNSGQCELLDVPRLAAQLFGLERRTSRGGRDSIDHSPGGHDDLANAVAGVLVHGRGETTALERMRAMVS
ncbi:terminase large subunit domain-containing protein [Teichococcus aestuarii]|nr:terminase family protein [Pseudoroseomonas aestuarii]